MTTSDNAFAGGTKQDQDCAKVITAKAPNKDDLKRVYFSNATVDGHVYLNLAWVRIPQNTTSPSAHIAFEFNQSETPCPAGSDGLVRRSTANGGDVLIVYDFEGGATDTPTIRLSRWIGSGACEVGSNSPPCWGPAQTLGAGVAEARVNTSVVGPVSDAIHPDAPPAQPLQLNEFGEAGIDLTDAGVFPAGQCRSFGNAFAVSRTSGSSSTAQMKDLVGPGNVNITNCGTVNIIKQTDPRGLDEPFSFTTNLAGAEMTCDEPLTGTLPSRSFTLNDTGNTGKTLGSTADAQNSDGNTQTCSSVPAGSFTVTEGADPPDFTFRDATCTATGTGTSVNVNGKVASITMAGGGSVTCVYVNLEDKQTTLNTAQGFIPQDTATITGTGLTFTGTVDFKLRQGTLSDPADCGTANDTNPVVYSEDNVAVTQTAPHTASTDNSGDPNVNGGYTILDGASEGPYYWEVTYDGPTGGDPDVTSCNEVSTVSINNGTGVSNPPATP